MAFKQLRLLLGWQIWVLGPAQLATKRKSNKKIILDL